MNTRRTHNPEPPPADDAVPPAIAQQNWHFDHVSVSMGADHALVTLFEGVMDFKAGPRPPFPFPGSWLYEGQQAVVHAIEDTSLSAQAGELSFNHIAFKSSQPASRVIERLERTALPFKVARIPDGNIAQIFVQLPGNFVVELDVPDDTENAVSHFYGTTWVAPTKDDR